MAKTGNPLDQLVDYGVAQFLAEAEERPDDIPPVGSRKLSEEGQRQRYLEMRDSPSTWRKLLDEHGLRQTVAYAGRMAQAMQTRGTRPDAEP